MQKYPYPPTGNLLLDKDLKRWYPLIAHERQLALIEAVGRGIRFPLVPAGRRSGKTERFKRFLTKEANRVQGQYFAAAPTYTQAKKIFWKDLKSFCLSSILKKKPSETELIIYLDNGSEIHVLGLDKPERIEGIAWKGGGIDEFADIKSEAWEANILPALNTVDPTDPDYRAWCWLLGVPDGLNHYYQLCQNAENNPIFEIFHWKSAEILPKDVIEQMKKTMSNRQFKQEFEASFETASGRIYEDYSKLNHTNESILEYEQLLWCHDFNYTPRSSAICVERRGSIYALDEIVLDGGGTDAKHSALEFVERYKDHKNKNVIIFGDPAGKAGEKHSLASDYTKMEVILKEHDWHFTRKVKAKAPAIKDRQNAVRAKILNAENKATFFINPQKCKYLNEGLNTVQFKQGSTFLEEETKYQHITTAVGYMIDYLYPVRKHAKHTDVVYNVPNTVYTSTNSWMR